MKAKFIASILAVPLLGIASLAFAQASPVGTWVNIDDVSKKPKSVIEITDQEGQIRARVTKVLQSDQGPHPICIKCDGVRKNKPIEGMEIMWGVHKSNGSTWDGGQILDPHTGKVYSVKLTPAANGKTMVVRGYMGFALLGRSQEWIRQP